VRTRRRLLLKYEQVIEAQLETLVPLELESGPREQRDDLADLESVMLVGFHTVEYPEIDQHVEDLIDGRRRNSENEVAAAPQQVNYGFREGLALVVRHVLEHCERADTVEGVGFLGYISRKPPWPKLVVGPGKRPSEVRVEPDAVAQSRTESTEQLTVVASDIEDSASRTHHTDGAGDAASAYETVERFHDIVPAKSGRTAEGVAADTRVSVPRGSVEAEIRALDQTSRVARSRQSSHTHG
jgi:hypothetical protein